MVKISRLNAIIFLLMFFVFVLSSKTMEIFHTKITGIEYLMWFGFVGLLVIVNFYHFSKKILLINTYFFILLVLVVFCFLNYFFADVPFIRYLQGTYFSFLFAANFILFYNIKFEKQDLYNIIKTVIFFLTAIAILAYLERFFISGHYESFYLRGVRTIVKDQGLASTLFNMNIILCFGMFIIKGKKKYLLIAAFSFVTIALLLFLKAIASSLIICVVFIFIFFKPGIRKYLFYTFGILLVLFIAILGKPFFKEISFKQNLYFGKHSETTPRNALYIAGFNIAKDYFPFGSGQGTFGSYPVGKNYSEIYYKYGLDKVYGLGPDAITSKKENFLFDTYWSHILGEMGFIATFFYLWLWGFPALKAVRFLISPDPAIKAFSFIITMTIITIFVESFALSIPEQLQFIMLYAGLGAIAFKLLFQNLSMQQNKN